MATPRKSTSVRISDDHRDWIDYQRAEAGGLSRDAYLRALLAEFIRQWQVARALTDAAQIRSRAAVAAWRPLSTDQPTDLRHAADGDSGQALR